MQPHSNRDSIARPPGDQISKLAGGVRLFRSMELLEDPIGCLERMKTIIADKSYRGTFAEVVEKASIGFEIPDRPNNAKGFNLEAKRWVVERTFAWLNFFRRVAIDCEHTPHRTKPKKATKNIILHTPNNPSPFNLIIPFPYQNASNPSSPAASYPACTS